jgi:hypothetical protein
VQCERTYWGALVLYIFLFVALAVWHVFYFPKWSATSSILVWYLQSVSLVAAGRGSSVAAVFGLTLLNPSNAGVGTCIAPMSVKTEFLFRAMTPVFALLAVGMCGVVEWVVRSVKGGGGKRDGKSTALQMHLLPGSTER